jgi:hypothetical protein
MRLLGRSATIIARLIIEAISDKFQSTKSVYVVTGTCALPVMFIGLKYCYTTLLFCFVSVLV